MKRINSIRSLALTCILVAPHGAAARAQQPAQVRTLVAGVPYEVDIQAVSPNGKFVAQSTSKATEIYVTATHRTIHLLDIGSDVISELVWSPASDRLAWSREVSGTKDRQIWTAAIDPSTGAVRGSMQRVSMGNATSPKFSSDGRSIAYSTPSAGSSSETRTWASGDLMIVPVAGGPARVVAHIPGTIWPSHWSADNKSIYVETMVPAKSPAPSPIRSILKVQSDNGATEVLRTGQIEAILGVTSDRRFAVVLTSITAAGFGATIIDADGKEVERVQMPAGADGGIGVLGDSALVIRVNDRPHRVLEIRPLAGGTPRSVPLVGESNSAPIWSPDGKQIAFEVTENGHIALAVMKATGGAVEVFHDARVGGIPWSHGEPKWSPDSKYIGFFGAEPGSIMILDVEARTARTLLAASVDTVGAWVWRPDGRSVAFVSMNRSLRPFERIEEITVNGNRRTLEENSKAFPGRPGQGGFVGGTGRFRVTDSGLFVASLDSKAVRRLTGDAETRGLTGAAVSSDLKWLGGVLGGTAPGAPFGLAVYSLETGMRHTIDVPATITPTFGGSAFTPDSKQLLVAGTEKGDSIMKLFAFPLAGGAPHAVAILGSDKASAYFSTSPDGKFVVYSVQPDAPTSSLVLVDLKPILARAALRSSRE